SPSTGAPSRPGTSGSSPEPGSRGRARRLTGAVARRRLPAVDPPGHEGAGGGGASWGGSLHRTGLGPVGCRPERRWSRDVERQTWFRGGGVLLAGPPGRRNRPRRSQTRDQPNATDTNPRGPGSRKRSGASFRSGAALVHGESAVSLGGEHEVALGQAIDGVGPDPEPRAPPAELDVGVVPLLLGDRADPVHERERGGEVWKTVLLVEMVPLDHLPAVRTQPGEQLVETRLRQRRVAAPAGDTRAIGEVGFEHGGPPLSASAASARPARASPPGSPVQTSRPRTPARSPAARDRKRPPGRPA